MYYHSSSRHFLIVHSMPNKGDVGLPIKIPNNFNIKVKFTDLLLPPSKGSTKENHSINNGVFTVINRRL